MQTRLDALSAAATYHLLTQTVIPRPIAWVLTVDPRAGRHNLAPFSFFAPLSSEPPLLGFSIGNALGGRRKDTDLNCELGSPLVIHIASLAQRHSLQASAAPFPREMSELADPSVQAELDDGWDFPLPRIAAAPVAFGCRVAKRSELGRAPGDQVLVIARADIVWVHDDAESLDARGRRRIDPRVLDPLARLGAGRFAAVEPD